MMESFDACVVGSGAGGGAVAYALAKAGWKTAVVERGAHFTEKDFLHDEISMCRRSMFRPDPLQEPTTVIQDGVAVGESTWPGMCVGGGTVLMSGFFFRMHARDFRDDTIKEGEHIGWPISLGKLQPYYDQVEKIIGLSGKDGANPFERRTMKYPLPPIAEHSAASLIDEACRTKKLHAFPTPRAILSQPYDGRSSCHYCGFCGSYGCEAKAKSSSRVTFLAQAEQTGNLTLLPNTRAIRVLANGGKATGVRVRVAGKQRDIRARVVVVAAAAIESARLLLVSDVGNEHGRLGKGLFFSSFAAGWGRYESPNPAFGERPGAPFLSRSVQDYYDRAGTIVFLRPHFNPIFQADLQSQIHGTKMKAFGSELMKRLDDFYRNRETLEYEVFARFPSNDGTYVSLLEKRDRDGVPLVKLNVKTTVFAKEAVDKLVGEAEDILKRAGASETGRFPKGGVYYFLQGGTTAIGHDPKRSYADVNGRVHTVANLYVAGGGALPSAGAAPFTFTIMANSLRIGQAIVAAGK